MAQVMGKSLLAEIEMTSLKDVSFDFGLLIL